MGFYIRKAFSSGPIRLNLSKHGLGLSGGVTGARLGVNNKGVYVHGGREGLYYRKYLNEGSGKPGSSQQRSSGGKVDLFRDTGVTFQAPEEAGAPSIESPELPDDNLLILPFRFLTGLVVVLLVVGLLTAELVLQLLGVAGIAALFGWTAVNAVWRNRARKALRQTVDEAGQAESGVVRLPVETFNRLPGRWKKWLGWQLHALIGEMAIRRETIDTGATLHDLDEKVPVNSGGFSRLRAAILDELLDEMLEDHLLDREEETAIRGLLDLLELPDSFKKPLSSRIEHYSSIRREMERPLEPIEPEIPLLQGEKAYDEFEKARLLNERVLDRFQKNKVKYRVIGYEADIEGKLILTDRRLLFVGEGSREYRLNHIYDITTDLEARIVELTMRKRKSPLRITVEEPLLLATRIEKIRDEEVMADS